MITSGSGLERFMNCRASNVLFRAFDERNTVDASRGKEVHKFLQLVGGGTTVDASLEAIDERFQPAAAAIDLDSLQDVLGLTPEMTIAYNPECDTARVLGVGLERQYEEAGLTDEEVPVTMDVVGLDRPVDPSRGAVFDYKTGWGRISPTERNWQMRGGALALARAFDLDDVDAQLIYLREGQSVKRDRARFSAADLAVIANEARLRWQLAKKDRALYIDKSIVPDATRGSWCGYCASFYACPGQIGLVKELVGPQGVLVNEGSMPLEQDKIAEFIRRIDELDPAWKALKRSMYAIARERPVLTKTLPDGTQVWLGVTEVVGNEKIDADKARAVVKEMLDEAAVDEVSKYSVSKERIAAAAKKRVPKGKGAEKEREIYAALKKRGGIHRPVKHEVDYYTLKPAQLAPSKVG